MHAAGVHYKHHSQGLPLTTVVVTAASEPKFFSNNVHCRWVDVNDSDSDSSPAQGEVIDQRLQKDSHDPVDVGMGAFTQATNVSKEEFPHWRAYGKVNPKVQSWRIDHP